MGMTIDDMYDWLYRLKSELVVYMPKEWHEPMRCSIQDAITFSRKYQMFEADYENRLKADMVAMLTEIQVGIDEHINPSNHTDSYEDGWSEGAEWCIDYIQEKINSLKENTDGNK